jgi:hypothetical protein
MKPNKTLQELVPPEPLVGAFRQREAAAYIGMGEDWLEDAPIERSDI